MIPYRSRLEAIGRLTARSFSCREALLRYQSRQLTSLIGYAARNVPYYRNLFRRSGFSPRDFRGVQDLHKVPISSKDDILSAPREELISNERKTARLIERTTAGSTGRPFTVRCTWFEERYLSALRFRMAMKMGVRLNDRIAHIRYVRRASSDEGWVRLFGLLGLLRITRLSSSLSPQEIACGLERIQPDVIRGYANLTTFVADAVQEAGSRIRPRFITVGGDTMTQGMRKRISEAFRAPVREVYGSHEFNLMAWQCEVSSNLHVCEEGVVLEVLDDDRPVGVGERGEVVATALHSFAQPFIRYRLGDLATRGEAPCACGLPYSTIRSIDGRIYDRIILPDGRAASPGDVLSRLERGFDWIAQYQMVQESRDLVILRLVPKRDAPPDELKSIHQMMERFLGPEMRYRVNLLRALPLAPNEKFRASMSRVFSNYGQPS